MKIDTETVTITSAGKPDVVRTVSALRGMVAKLRGEDTADLFVLNLRSNGAATFSIRGVHCTAHLNPRS